MKKNTKIILAVLAGVALLGSIVFGCLKYREYYNATYILIDDVRYNRDVTSLDLSGYPIVEAEKLTAEKEEVAQALAMVCRQNNMTTEQIKPYYDEEFEKALVKSVLTGKAMHLIREAAVITEV